MKWILHAKRAKTCNLHLYGWKWYKRDGILFGYYPGRPILRVAADFQKVDFLGEKGALAQIFRKKGTSPPLKIDLFLDFLNTLSLKSGLFLSNCQQIFDLFIEKIAKKWTFCPFCGFCTCLYPGVITVRKCDRGGGGQLWIGICKMEFFNV